MGCLPAEASLLKEAARHLVSLLVLATLTARAGPATGEEYEREIMVEDREDLDELLAADEISSRTHAVLSALLEHPVDLNTARRRELLSLPGLTPEDADAILTYRREFGPIRHPLDLSACLSLARLQGILPFVSVAWSETPVTETRLRARLRTAFSPVDGAPPTQAAQIQLDSSHHLRAGVAVVTTRKRLGDLGWNEELIDVDGRRGVLVADPERERVHVPKYVLLYRTAHLSLLGGTYSAGFGQRLTFDSTDRAQPNGYDPDLEIEYPAEMGLACRESGAESPGNPPELIAASPCVGDAQYRRSLSDFSWHDGLRGVAIQLTGLGGVRAESGAQLSLWTSAASRSIYQYDVVHTEFCRDPEDSSDNTCESPAVYRRQPDPAQETTRFKYQTLPNLYGERLVGMNISYFGSARIHLGLTGYLADIRWVPKGATIDFAGSAPRPPGGGFGAAGIDFAWGKAWFDCFAEAAHSLDQASRGGGWAAILRTTASGEDQELEWSGRFYDPGFVNPYAGATAAADEVDGLRSRDELGTAIKYVARVARALTVRTTGDLWSPLSVPQPKLTASTRVDYRATARVEPGLRLAGTSKDVRQFDRRDCYATPAELQEEGEPVPCRGEKLEVSPYLSTEPWADLLLVFQYTHTWVDDEARDRAFRQGSAFYVRAGWRPASSARIRARVRWSREDLQDNHHSEQQLWASVDLSQSWRPGLQAQLRYDHRLYLDERPSTRARSPNPEQWFRFEVEQRF